MRRAFARVGNTRGRIASRSFRSAKTNGRFKKSQPLSPSQSQCGLNSDVSERPIRVSYGDQRRKLRFLIATVCPSPGTRHRLDARSQRPLAADEKRAKLWRSGGLKMPTNYLLTPSEHRAEARRLRRWWRRHRCAAEMHELAAAMQEKLARDESVVGLTAASSTAPSRDALH